MLRQFITTTLKKNNYTNGEMVLLVGDFNVDSRKPFIEISKISAYPGFKVANKKDAFRRNTKKRVGLF